MLVVGFCSPRKASFVKPQVPAERACDDSILKLNNCGILKKTEKSNLNGIILFYPHISC